MPSKTQTESHLLDFIDCARAVDEMFRSVPKSSDSGPFAELRQFVRNFNNLSIFNAMLVRTQRPGAAAVGTRKQWLKIGRRIKAGAIPIVILKPFGPVMFVYEQGDTEGQELLPGLDGNPFQVYGEFDDKTLSKTIEAIKKYNIEVEISDKFGGFQAGAVFNSKHISGESRFLIKLNNEHDKPAQYATLAHELGHVFCGHVGGDHKGRWPDRTKLPKRVRELEAEAVSWLVCQRMNITTNSEEYLARRADRISLRHISMYAIFEAANRIERK